MAPVSRVEILSKVKTKKRKRGSLMAKMYLIMVAAKKLCFSKVYWVCVVAFVSHFRKILTDSIKATVASSRKILFKMRRVKTSGAKIIKFFQL